jgi:hypothetical protein
VSDAGVRGSFAAWRVELKTNQESRAKRTVRRPARVEVDMVGEGKVVRT